MSHLACIRVLSSSTALRRLSVVIALAALLWGCGQGHAQWLLRDQLFDLAHSVEIFAIAKGELPSEDSWGLALENSDLVRNASLSSLGKYELYVSKDRINYLLMPREWQGESKRFLTFEEAMTKAADVRVILKSDGVPHGKIPSIAGSCRQP